MLVLEAGNDHINDTKAQCPGIFASMYGDHEYDWDYRNVPQVSFPLNTGALPWYPPELTFFFLSHTSITGCMQTLPERASVVAAL